MYLCKNIERCNLAVIRNTRYTAVIRDKRYTVIPSPNHKSYIKQPIKLFVTNVILFQMNPKTVPQLGPAAAKYRSPKWLCVNIFILFISIRFIESWAMAKKS